MRRMSEGKVMRKHEWNVLRDEYDWNRPFHISHPNTSHGWYGGIGIALKSDDNNADVLDEQCDRLAAWLNHIAPDGVIPPAPGGEGG